MSSPSPRLAETTETSKPADFELLESHPMALDAEDMRLVSAAGGASWAETETAGIPYAPVAEPWISFDPAKLWRAFVEFVRLPIRVFAVGGVIYMLAFNLSVVRGSSMAPGIHDGDRILIDQFSYLFSDVAHGDVVVLQYPLDPKLDYIKRIIGLPGDEIVMAMGKLWVNGEQVEEMYLDEVDPYTRVSERVLEDHYYVLGDNRLHSSDSREFGQVRRSLVRGKVDVRLWPPDRIGRIR